MSAAERASKASSAEQANEGAVRANKRMDEHVAQYLRPNSWVFCPTVEREIERPEEAEERRGILKKMVNIREGKRKTLQDDEVKPGEDSETAKTENGRRNRGKRRKNGGR